MVSLEKIKKIYMYSNEISFRLGIDGLTNIILSEFKEEEVEGNMYVFFSRNHKQIKIIEYDKKGTWLYQNKLYSGRFVAPNIDGTGNMQIDKRQLEMIIQNIEIIDRRIRAK